VAVSRRTIDRWIVARRAGGFDALVPAPRQCAPRTEADVVELAAGLKMENPARTAAQVRRILAARLGWAPSERAIQRWFAARELTTRPDGRPPQAFGRFQADAVNEIWTADLMNGPPVGGSAAHKEAVARLRWLISARGLGVITGEVGSGKTAAVRAATSGLDASRHTLIYLPNPQIGVRGIHGAVAAALGQAPRFHHATLIPQVEAALAAETDERNRHVVLAIDESHLMSHDQLEAVRLLTLCRDRDYAGDLMNFPIPQPVRGQLSRHNSCRFLSDSTGTVSDSRDGGAHRGTGERSCTCLLVVLLKSGFRGRWPRMRTGSGRRWTPRGSRRGPRCSTCTCSLTSADGSAGTGWTRPA